jgi:hypothetical protein
MLAGHNARRCLQASCSDSIDPDAWLAAVDSYLSNIIQPTSPAVTRCISCGASNPLLCRKGRLQQRGHMQVLVCLVAGHDEPPKSRASLLVNLALACTVCHKMPPSMAAAISRLDDASSICWLQAIPLGKDARRDRSRRGWRVGRSGCECASWWPLQQGICLGPLNTAGLGKLMSRSRSKVGPQYRAHLVCTTSLVQ